MLDFGMVALALATPVILAAMGGYASERGGVVNIALEGMMLAGACTAALTIPYVGPIAGLGLAIVAATGMALLHWAATQVYRIDHVVSGMAVNALAFGGADFASKAFADPAKSTGIATIPADFYRALALITPFAVALYVSRSRAGLRLQAVGSDPDKARLMGVNPARVRLFGLLASGVFTGLAGAYLIADTGAYTDNLTAGRGFIALATLILGGWRPVPTLLAGLAFGVFSALNLTLQGSRVFGWDIPNEAWSSLPYLATIIALAGFFGRNRTPAGLGKP